MSFDLFSDEILQYILYYCAPHDLLLNVQRACKRLHRLGSEPLLWRYHSKVEFHHWDARHRICEKFRDPVEAVDWKGLYIYRQQVDCKTSQLLESILRAQVDRISKFTAIASFGYDAKDTLLRHCRADDHAEDVLARRYYANSVLDHLHRAKALEEWQSVLDGKEVSLERALGAFDMFILHDRYGDLSEISELLDALANTFRLECREFQQLTIRKKALATLGFLRKRNLTGLSSETALRDLQNNYIGISLQLPDHPSLPLISVAIFCAFGRRLGIDARCCAIPSHPLAIVLPWPGETLDRKPLKDDNAGAEVMYLDPFQSDQEVTLRYLHRKLSSWGLQRSQFSGFLTDTTLPHIILRTSRNILATIRSQEATSLTTRLDANSVVDLENAYYSALWANFMFSTQSNNPPQIQLIAKLLDRYERQYPMDGSFIEKHILPLYQNLYSPVYHDLVKSLRVFRAADQTAKQVRLRQPPANHRVKYRVGQVFRHRRYGYTAVITGWETECGSDWMLHNNVDYLSRGRYQSFYHALTSCADDTSIRYIAEENIEIIEPDFPTTLMTRAGKFFRRWENESHMFVSNIRDEYPED